MYVPSYIFLLHGYLKRELFVLNKVKHIIKKSYIDADTLFLNCETFFSYKRITKLNSN